jgi:glutathione synthase/RimK-type ligase-like ATP-grasp enzyme
MQYRIVILANENDTDHYLWVKSCEKYNDRIKFRVVKLTSHNWLEEIRKESIDLMLAKPGGFTNKYKQLYDERIYVLVNNAGYRVFPTLDEILIYENKRFLSFWLQTNRISHPETAVFYDYNSALVFVKESEFPIIAKLNIGASGSGVKILRDITEGKKYIKRIFSKGIVPSTGPKLKKGNIAGRVLKKFLSPEELRERISTYISILTNPQAGFCIFQKYIKHDFEWRVVRIGNSFYAHKKMVRGEKASGSLIKEYAPPPLSLLSFVKDITDRYSFFSQAIDIFEVGKDQYLVNEMQCIFGQTDPYQMMVNNKPGRYIYINGHWLFEEGTFNTNECFDERVEFIISMLDRERTK